MRRSGRTHSCLREATLKICLAGALILAGRCARVEAGEPPRSIELEVKNYKQVRFVAPMVKTRERGGKEIYIAGMIENMTTGYISGMRVKAEIFNEEGGLIDEGESLVLPRIIRARGPGTGRFAISLPYNDKARRCFLDVTWQEKPGREKDTSLLGQL